jgi:hypothetical protein
VEEFPAARTRSKNSFCSQNTVKSFTDTTIGEL